MISRPEYGYGTPRGHARRCSCWALADGGNADAPLLAAAIETERASLLELHTGFVNEV
jgi:hypothetical protein